MAQTVVGLFDTSEEAMNVVRDLERNGGFMSSDINIIANDASGEYANRLGKSGDKMNDNAAEQAGSGAVAGAATGAGLGVLAGIAALAIPGIGPVIAAGPLAAALGAGAATVGTATAIGAGVGAASGALVGPLVDAGIPRPEAEAYYEGVRRGGTLVIVRADEAGEAEAAAGIMARYNVVDIDRRTEDWNTSGWKYDANAQPYTSDQIHGFRTQYQDAQPEVYGSLDTRTADNATLRGTGTGDDQVLEVIEEELQIGKRAIQRGGTRVRTFITERPVEEQVRLRDETVRVERRPVTRDLADTDKMAFQERTIEMTETDEEAVVAKRARVIEEVVIRKEVEERTETIRDTVRRQDVDISQMSDDMTTSNIAASDMGSERAVGDTGFSTYDADFRNHYQSHYGTSGLAYDAYGPVYRYGYNVANDSRYTNSDWNTIEPDLRSRWEERNPGTWDQFKDGVRYAWDRARGKA